MSEFPDFQQRLADEIAKSFGIPYATMAQQFSLAESSAAMFARHMREQRARQDAATVKELLGHWVSEVEPVIWYGHSGQLVGVGDRARIVILTPKGRWAKAIQDSFFEQIGWAE